MSIHVLIVDDAPLVLKGLAAFLRQLGCLVTVAAGGAEALAAAQGTQFDAIFLDCLMPKLDGLEVARAIREQNGHNRGVRIIGMRSAKLGMCAERCLEAGMDDSLEKLADTEAYEAALRRWFPELEAPTRDSE